MTTSMKIALHVKLYSNTSMKLKANVLSFMLIALTAALASALASIIVSAFILTSIPTALANPESELATDEIVQLDAILYKIFRSPEGYTALVGGQLHPETPLPAQFEVAIPAGAKVFWFGEISGGPREDDRSFPEPFTVRSEGDFDIYTAITYEHIIQMEYLIDGEPFERLGDGNHLFRLSYTPLHDASVLRLAAYLPMGSHVEDPNFVHLGYAPQTEEPLYGITLHNVSGGQTYEFDLLYGPPPALARQGEGNLLGGVLVTIAAVGGAAIAMGVAFTLSKRRKAQAAAYDYLSYDEAEEEGHP